MSILTSDWLYWLQGLGVLLVNAALVYVAWWALFADRARGRRRCPRCWYDMAYSPGMRCAECGFVAKHESQFGRTRRRYGIAIAAILAGVTIGLFVTERVTQRGLAAHLPSHALLWVLPLSGPGGDVYDEVIRRLRNGELSRAHEVALIERCAAGDWRSRPTSDGWINRYGSLLWRSRLGYLGDSEIEAALLSIPPRISASTREVWPTDAPVTVAVQVHDWWPWGMECRIRATPRAITSDGDTNASAPAARAIEPITFYRTGDTSANRSPFALHLPSLDPATTQIMIDFQIERRRMREAIQRIDPHTPALALDDNDRPWEPIATQTVSVKTRIEGTIDQVMVPVDDEFRTDVMREVFGRGAVKWTDGPSPVRVNVRLQPTLIPQFNDTAVGVVVELLCDGVVARQLNLWWLAGSAGGDRNYGYEVAYENLELLRTANESDGKWQMRVRGDGGLALRAGAAKKYWAGQYLVPLRVEQRDRHAPPRPWWTQ